MNKPSITGNSWYNVFFWFRMHFLQVEYYLHALLSPDPTDHHLDQKADVSEHFDENATLIMNGSMLREICLDNSIYIKVLSFRLILYNFILIYWSFKSLCVFSPNVYKIPLMTKEKWCVWGVYMTAIKLLKFVTGLCPKSAHRMGQRPPFDIDRSWSNNRNLLLWRLVLRSAVYLQPLRMCAFVSGD